MKKLTKQEWAVGEELTISFQAKPGYPCKVIIKKGKVKIACTPEEAKELKNIFESTNFIFKDSNEFITAKMVRYNYEWKDSLENLPF